MISEQIFSSQAPYKRAFLFTAGGLIDRYTGAPVVASNELGDLAGVIGDQLAALHKLVAAIDSRLVALDRAVEALEGSRRPREDSPFDERPANQRLRALIRDPVRGGVSSRFES